MAGLLKRFAAGLLLSAMWMACAQAAEVKAFGVSLTVPDNWSSQGKGELSDLWPLAGMITALSAALLLLGLLVSVAIYGNGIRNSFSRIKESFMVVMMDQRARRVGWLVLMLGFFQASRVPPAPVCLHSPITRKQGSGRQSRKCASTAEQVIEMDAEWSATMKQHLQEHVDDLCFREETGDYAPAVEALLQLFKKNCKAAPAC